MAMSPRKAPVRDYSIRACRSLEELDRKSTRLNSSHITISYAVFCLKKNNRPIDEALFEELEEVLVAADLGAAIAADFTNRAREEVMFGTVTCAEQLRPLVRRFLTET